VNVAIGIEGVPCALAATPTQRDQNVIAEMEAVHWNKHSQVSAELIDELVRDL
jgi:hypothetical protein